MLGGQSKTVWWAINCFEAVAAHRFTGCVHVLFVDLPFQIARCIHPRDVVTLVNDFLFFLHEEFLTTAN